ASGRIRQRAVERTESSAAAGQETRLVTAAHCGLIGSKPGNLPGKSDRRAEVVEVFRIWSEIRIRRAGSDECQLRQLTALPRSHPILESAAGISEQGVSAADGRRGQAVGDPWHTVIIPSQAEVQRQVAFDFPI